MTIDFTKPVQTRNGYSVRIISTDGHQYYPVVGYIGDAKSPAAWGLDGAIFSSLQVNDYDLIQVPEKKTLDVWINIYPTRHRSHATRKIADDCADFDRIACVHVVQEYTVSSEIEK
jgi:hypothetical protein